MKYTVLSNFKYSFVSQLVVLIFGIVRALVVPLILDVSGFGYWQIYLLYAGFVGIFSLGFNDGVYLRYGDLSKEQLPWDSLRGAIVVYLSVLVTISLLLNLSLEQLTFDTHKLLVVKYVIVNVFLMGCSSLYLFLYQTTNQIKKYSIYMLVDKVIFIVILLFLHRYSEINFETLMIIDCASKLLLVLAMTIDVKKELFGAVVKATAALKEFYSNIGAGFWLMLANLASMLVLNISRFFVEQFYSIEDFAAFSFGVTLTNIVLMALNGITVALYPLLKRTSVEKYAQIYQELNAILILLLTVFCIVYFPIKFFVITYMPKYSLVLGYFNILLVVSLIQIRMNLTITTFYKVLRKEGALLTLNIWTVFVGFVLSSAVVLLKLPVELIAVVLLLSVLFRLFVSDMYIKKHLGLKVEAIDFFELTLYLPFLIATYYNLTLITLIVLLFAGLIYIKYKGPHVMSAVHTFRELE